MGVGSQITTGDPGGAAPRNGGSSHFQREEIDAAVRGAGYSGGLHPDGVAAASADAAAVVEQFGGRIRDWQHWRDETTLVLAPGDLLEVATFLRDMLGYRLLSDISPCDWLDRRLNEPAAGKRFSISYIVRKLTHGAPQLRLRIWVDEGEDVPSVMGIWPTADWHEREAYDFFGIVFAGRAGLKRILMPDDWVGHPLRKDYPLGGEPVKFTNSLREL